MTNIYPHYEDCTIKSMDPDAIIGTYSYRIYNKDKCIVIECTESYGTIDMSDTVFSDVKSSRSQEKPCVSISVNGNGVRLKSLIGIIASIMQYKIIEKVPYANILMPQLISDKSSFSSKFMFKAYLSVDLTNTTKFFKDGVKQSYEDVSFPIHNCKLIKLMPLCERLDQTDYSVKLILTEVSM